MGDCQSCLNTDKEIVIQRQSELRNNNEDKNEIDDFDERYEKLISKGETRMERYERKTKEFFEDLKERAMNNLEHIKARFGNQNDENIKVEKID